jgi:hypothetical protein
MEFIPYRAFGLVFIVNKHVAGEVYKNVVRAPDCTIFCVQGKEVVTDDATGEHVLDFTAGQFYAPGNYIPGSLRCTVVEDTEVYCYDPKLNFGHEQNFTPWGMVGGSQTVIFKGTKLLLCKGSIEIDGTIYTAPARLNIESQDKAATVIENSIGLLIA